MNPPPPRRFSPCRSFATGMCFLGFFATLHLGGGAVFIDIPSALIACGLPFFLLLGLFGKTYLRFIPDAFLTFFTIPAAPNPEYADIAKTGSRLVIGAGVLGTLIGLIQLLSNLNDPSSIGQGMAIALLTSLYAIFISEIIFAFLYKAYSLPGPPPNKSSTLPLANLGIPIVVLTWIITVFFIFLLALTPAPVDYAQNGTAEFTTEHPALPAP